MTAILGWPDVAGFWGLLALDCLSYLFMVFEWVFLQAEPAERTQGI